MRRASRILILLLVFALILTGCEGVDEEESEDEIFEGSDTELQSVEPEKTPDYDTVFSIPYRSDKSLNPFLSTYSHNQNVGGLMFESLFELDNKLSPKPVLVEEYSTDDGITYNFTVKQGVLFHNGSTMTASDVAYSLNMAKSTDKFASRLSCVSSVQSTGEYSLTVTLTSANYNFPALLDTPIIQSNTVDDSIPVGTGPYMYDGEKLVLFSGYRSVTGSGVPEVIYLREVAQNDMAESFLGRDIDVLSVDMTGLNSVEVYALHETRTYSTTDFLYVGFNASYGKTSVPEIRRALSYLIDRDTICGDIYMGYVDKAPLILSSTTDVYDLAWEEDTEYSRESFLTAADNLGMEDANLDGYLEYNGSTMSLVLIVNEESEYKKAAAARIATDMENMGIKMEVQELPWDEYVEALETGAFSMYIGEAKLTADFNFSELLTSGGSLNYGAISDTSYGEMNTALLAAGTIEERTEAARSFCEYVKENAPIVPIAYKQYQVLTHIGTITGAVPSQSNIFSGVTGWNFTGISS